MDLRGTSAVRAVRYHAATSELDVRFEEGRQYRYSHVPKSIPGVTRGQVRRHICESRKSNRIIPQGNTPFSRQRVAGVRRHYLQTQLTWPARALNKWPCNSPAKSHWSPEALAGSEPQPPLLLRAKARYRNRR